MRNNGPSKGSWHRHIKPWWQNKRWPIVVVGVVTVFVLGYIGFYETKKSLSFFDIIYCIIKLFVLGLDAVYSNLNWKLEAARWLAPIISTYIAANALAVIFREQMQMLKIRFLRRHIIICGLGNKGLLLSLKFKEYGYNVVVIELDEENDNIKECRDSGASVLVGNAMAPYILRRAGLKKVKYLIPVCGEDGINAGIAAQVRKLVGKKRRKPLTCIVHIVDPQLCRLIKEKEFETEKNEAFRLEFFNLFDQAAKSLTDTFPPFNEKKEIRQLSPHILIVGSGGVGERLMVHTASKWMYLPGRTDERFKISILDREAEQKRDLYYLRYPGLKKVCELIPLEMNIKSPGFEDGRFLFNDNGECNLTIIYVCLDNESFALSTALTLHHKLRSYDIPVIVRMNSEAGLAELVQEGTHGTGRLYGFGLLDRVLKPGLLLIGTHETLARAIHDEYLIDQFTKGETTDNNLSLVAWEELPETLKDSNRRQAAYLGVKLKSIGCYIVPMVDWNANPIEFTYEEIEEMAKMEHDDWMEERIKDGWKYAHGPKDIENKKSPSLVPWEELSKEDKEKDRSPVRKMPAFLAKAGFQIYRK